MEKAKLLRLAEHLENGRPGGHVTFDFSTYRLGTPSEKHCGTAGCALGECMVLWPERFTINPSYAEGLYVDGRAMSGVWAGAFFGISSEAALALFWPCHERWWAPGEGWLTGTATAEEVARSIRMFVSATEALASAAQAEDTHAQ